MQETSLSYTESLKMAWLLIWRAMHLNGSMGFVVGFFIGFALGLLGMREWVAPISAIIGSLLAVFVGSPWVVRMLFRKKFSGFQLRIIR